MTGNGRRVRRPRVSASCARVAAATNRPIKLDICARGTGCGVGAAIGNGSSSQQTPAACSGAESQPTSKRPVMPCLTKYSATSPGGRPAASPCGAVPTAAAMAGLGFVVKSFKQVEQTCGLRLGTSTFCAAQAAAAVCRGGWLAVPQLSAMPNYCANCGTRLQPHRKVRSGELGCCCWRLWLAFALSATEAAL